MSPPIQPSSPKSTDTIIPFHFWDDLPHTRGLCLNITLRFDSQLDPDKLRTSLIRLLEIDNWRKLGARLRQDSKGNLTYHLPSKFTTNRPGFTFTTEHHETDITSHPIASQMPPSKPPTPTPKSSIRIYDSMIKYHPLVRHKSAPASLEDLLNKDIPQLSIHSITFKNATLLTITFQHTLMDAAGLSGFLNAWTSVLSNEEESVPPLLGFEEDILQSHMEPVPATKHVLASAIFGQISLLIFTFLAWWERYWYPEVGDRVFVIPGEYVQELKEQALQELADTEPGVEIESHKLKRESLPFISESDILLTWLASLLVAAHNPRRTSAVQICNVFDIRSVLGLPSGVYIGNATMAASAGFEAREFRRDNSTGCGLGYVAVKMRGALERQRAKEQVFAYAALQKEMIEKTGFPPLTGLAGQLGITCTNWQRAGLFDVDFGGARVGEGRDCRPSYINVTGPGPLNEYAPRNLMTVTGRDLEGDWWVQVIGREEVLGKVERWMRARERVG